MLLYQNYSPNSGYDREDESGNSDATGDGAGSCLFSGAGSRYGDGEGCGKGDGSGDWLFNSLEDLSSGSAYGCHVGYMDSADSAYAGGAETGWFDPST